MLSDTEKNQNQKGGSLEGADEEMIESSDSVLQKQGYKGTKGLQQFYSPPELGAFVKATIGTRIPTLDPTAGDGMLLSEIDPQYRFGIEIDNSQIKNAEKENRKYHSIKGDLQYVYDLIRKIDLEFDAVVANPPFDLKWSNPYIADKEISSTKMTFLMMETLLSYDGAYMFVCGKDRAERELAETDFYGETCYALIEINDLFPDVELPCVILMGAKRGVPYYVKQNGPMRRQATRETLGDAATWVNETKSELRIRTASYSYRDSGATDAWPAIQKEHDQRNKERLGKYERKFDFEVGSNGKLHVVLSPYAKIILGQRGDLGTLERLNNHMLSYFRQNEAAWRLITECAEDGLISVEQKLTDRVNNLLSDNRKIQAPLYPLKDIQSLGFLDQIDRILCTRSDKERGLTAGERYNITVRPTEYQHKDTRYEANKKTGEWQEKTYLQRRMRLRIQIRNDSGSYNNFYDDEDSQGDIQYLIDHFDIKAPPDLGELFPEEVHRMRSLVSDIELDTIIPNSAKALLDDPDLAQEWQEAIEQGEIEYAEWAEGDKEAGFTQPLGVKLYGVRLRKFQREDLARGLVKGNFVCAWEQGLGKTLAALVYIEACRRLGRSTNQALILAPNDLIPQWMRETKRFMGVELELIAPRVIKIENPEKGKNKRKMVNHTVPVHAIAADVAKRMREGGEGWFISYHEALSTIGTRASEDTPHYVIRTVPQDPEWIPGHYDYSGDEGTTYVEGHYKDRPDKEIMSWEECPKCGAGLRDGYDGKNCTAKITDQKLGKVGSGCGYTHAQVRVKPAGSLLSTAFQAGTIVIDELTQIGCSASGEESLRSKTARGLRAKNKLGMTGTPIKNYITQLYWPLRWVLGNEQFGYAWGTSGWNQFISDFAVVEWDVSKGTKQNRKPRPEITNLSMLWKTLAGGMIRRRQEESGEQIVDMRYHEHTVPLGVGQRMRLQLWMKNFHELFKEKYPNSKVVRANMQEALAPMLGMKPKLEYTLTCPEADPDKDWYGIAAAGKPTNWTPNNFRTLELAMALAKEGRKVLVGSATKETGRWLADQLNSIGVKAEHILEDSGETFSAKKRAEVVYSFQTSETQVFCAGMQAIRLGHNLDAGSAVVINGLPWDWETFSQFVYRVRRLTSLNDIDCHIVLPHGSNQTLTEKKWELLLKKREASELALDGRLIPKTEEEIDWKSVMQELVEAGLSAAGDEIREEDIEGFWKKIESFDTWKPRKGLLTSAIIVKKRKHDWSDAEPFYTENFPYLTGSRALVALPMVADQGGTRFGEVMPEEEFIEPEISLNDDDVDDLSEPDTDDGIEETVLTPTDDPEYDEGERQEQEKETNATKFSESSPNGDSGTRTDIVQAIKGLAELHDLDILTDEEFAEQKTALLTQLKELA